MVNYEVAVVGDMAVMERISHLIMVKHGDLLKHNMIMQMQPFARIHILVRRILFVKDTLTGQT